MAVCTALVTVAVVAAACSSQSPNQQAASLLNQGLAAQNAKNYSTATADYEKILTITGNSSILYALYDLALVEQDTGLTAAAEEHYRSALAINPNYTPALFNLAILLTSSSPIEAAQLYRQVIALEPNTAAAAPAHLNLGYVLISLKEKALGNAQLNEAYALEPSLRPATTTTTTPPATTTTTLPRFGVPTTTTLPGALKATTTT
jgi:tetratricopeptide (TPR) repeat protein